MYLFVNETTLKKTKRKYYSSKVGKITINKISLKINSAKREKDFIWNSVTEI